jgi:phosphoglucosamine mutase
LGVAPGAKLFGTDGVRGVAGEFVSAELAFALGRAVVAICRAPSPQVLVIRDTRASGEMLEAALCAGIAAEGGQALAGGVLPTPAASILTRRYGFDLAAVISASHNPYHDNGIKFFDGGGGKLSDEEEAKVERCVLEGVRPLEGVERPPYGRVRPLAGTLDDYLRALEARFDSGSLAGARVVLDCAHGATYQAAPIMFERLGAEVDLLACEPDGMNINEECGSTHMGPIAEYMNQGEYDIGFAFDGDGDRVLAVGRDGSVVDGDEIIAHAALDLQRRGELNGGVAVTVMTNFGFHNAMREAGIEVATTAVGDKHVVEELRERGWVLGGEQSGHIVDMRLTQSGDGIAAALLLMRALDGRPLEQGAVMQKLPQALVNVRVADRDGLAGAAKVWEAVEREGATLEGRGRVLVRASGTEPLVRLMAEAPTEEECRRVVESLAEMVRAELGAANGG